MKLMLAPMEGVVDWVMRDILTRAGGIDHCVTEFIRVTDQVIPDHVLYKYCPELKTGSHTRSGTPIFCQILGSNAEMLAYNAEKLISLGAIGIDLNFGCPAPTVNRHDGGATLLKNPHRLFDVISAVRKKVPTNIPVTAKVRLGFDHKNDHLDIAKAVEDGGASWLVVHARTKTDGYKPPAYWEYIRHMKNHIKIPVIANGEVWNLSDYIRIREESECDDVMIGRGAIASPFLFEQIKKYLKNPEISLTQPDWKPIAKLLPEFYESSEIYKSDKFATARCKMWLKYLSRNYSEAEEVFQRIKAIENGVDFKKMLLAMCEEHLK